MNRILVWPPAGYNNCEKQMFNSSYMTGDTSNSIYGEEVGRVRNSSASSKTCRTEGALGMIKLWMNAGSISLKWNLTEGIHVNWRENKVLLA